MTSSYEGGDSPGHVCLIDDDADVRTHLAELLSLLGYEVSTFESAQAFIQRANYGVPMVILLDMRMPGMSGLQLHAHLMEMRVPAAIVYASGHSEKQEIIDAMKQGAIDFLCKPFSREVLEAAIVEAMRKARHLLREDKLNASFRRGLEQLSPREWDVLHLMLNGYQNRQIAVRLNIQPDTVKKHRVVICEKFCVADTAQLIEMTRDLPDNLSVLHAAAGQTGDANFN